MKKCPYCAEEIQDDAIKCRHCKEWLKGREDNKENETCSTPESKTQNETSSTEQPQEINGLPADKSSKVTGDDEDVSKYVPIKAAGKYGWGWFLFVAMFANSHNPAVSAHVSFHNQAISILENLSIIPLLFVYFGFRKRFLKKLMIGQKRWPAGLKAGILTYLIWCVLFVPTAIIDTRLKNADFNEVIQKYKEEASNLQQREQQLIDSMIEEPQSIEDGKFNIGKIDALMSLDEQRRNTLRSMFDDFRSLYTKDGERGKKRIAALNHLETLNNKHFEMQTAAWKALQKYYATYNDADFNEYSTLQNDAETLAKEYQELSKASFK